jgi:hypothetical protein
MTVPPSVTTATLSDLAEDERYARFDRLQQGMAGVWDVMRLNHENESVVVIPSVTLRSGSLGQAYEERFLFCFCCCASLGCG